MQPTLGVMLHQRLQLCMCCCLSSSTAPGSFPQALNQLNVQGQRVAAQLVAMLTGLQGATHPAAQADEMGFGASLRGWHSLGSPLAATRQLQRVLNMHPSQPQLL